MLRSKINQKKLNENFSSIDPQGQESKAHRLWKWLMDNGSKTREEIYAFDRSYSTVLAKYWRNGLITLNGELYSAVPNYKFVDVRQIEDKNSELERIFQKFKDVKYKNIEDYINKYKEYYGKYFAQARAKAQLYEYLQSMQKQVDSMLRSVSYIEKNEEMYREKGINETINSTKFYKEKLRIVASDLKYVEKHPMGVSAIDKLLATKSKFDISIPDRLDSNVKEISDIIEYYKGISSNNDSQIIEKLLQRCKKLKENSLDLKDLTVLALDEHKKVIDNNPGGKFSWSEKDAIELIPREIYSDYEKLTGDPVYNKKVNDLIFYELPAEIDRLKKSK